MEVLITGGNGFVGRHLLLALQKHGDHVRVLTSPTSDTTWLEKHGVSVFRGDIRDPSTLIAPMSGVEGVIHLAAMMGPWRSMQDYFAVNVIGTEHVCRAALNAGVRRLVYSSTALVYGRTKCTLITEDALLSPLDEPYSMTKAQGDLLVQRMIREEHLPAAILRLSALFGPGDRLSFTRLADRLRGGLMPIVGSGNNFLSFVYIADVVQGFLLALHSEQAAGKVYNIGNDQPLTQFQYLCAIAQEIGATPRRIHVPYTLLYKSAAVAERIATLSGYRMTPFSTRHGIKVLGEDSHLSIEKARRELGYVPQVPILEGVRLTAQWYRQQNSWTPERNPTTQHVLPKMRNVSR